MREEEKERNGGEERKVDDEGSRERVKSQQHVYNLLVYHQQPISVVQCGPIRSVSKPVQALRVCVCRPAHICMCSKNMLKRCYQPKFNIWWNILDKYSHIIWERLLLCWHVSD